MFWIFKKNLCWQGDKTGARGMCSLSSPSSPSCAGGTSDSSICLQPIEQAVQHPTKTGIVSKRHQVLRVFLNWHNPHEGSFNIICQHQIFLPISKPMWSKEAQAEILLWVSILLLLAYQGGHKNKVKVLYY